MSLPQLEGDSAFFWDALAAQRTVFTDMSLFVRFNQRLENNRYPCPSASRTHKHPGVKERGRWIKTTPVWPGGVRLSCAFFGPHQEQSAGYNSRTESQRVCGECHRSSRAVCFYGTGCFNGAVVSPSLRLWTDDRRDSRLNLDPSKTTLCGYGMVHAAGPSFQPLKNTRIMDSHPL